MKIYLFILLLVTAASAAQTAKSTPDESWTSCQCSGVPTCRATAADGTEKACKKVGGVWHAFPATAQAAHPGDAGMQPVSSVAPPTSAQSPSDDLITTISTNAQVAACTKKGWPTQAWCEGTALGVAEAVTGFYAQDTQATKTATTSDRRMTTSPGPMSATITDIHVDHPMPPDDRTYVTYTFPATMPISVDVAAQTGRVVKLSDVEYARLQKLRQAVADAEREIAKAHDVELYVHCYSGTDLVAGVHDTSCHWHDGSPEALAGLEPPVTIQPDHYEFRSQFLLINLPVEATQ